MKLAEMETAKQTTINKINKKLKLSFPMKC